MPNRKKSFRLRPLHYIIALVAVLTLGVYSYYRSSMTPAEVYYIGDTPYSVDVIGGDANFDESGCQILKPVKCPQGATCEPYKVCQATAVSTGIAVGTTPERVPVPTVTPSSSCQPRPACLDATPACKIAEKPGQWCPTPTPTAQPVPSGCFVVSPSCPPGRMCAQYQKLICPTPTPTPTATATTYLGEIKNLGATTPCGPDSFASYSVVCKNGSTPQLKLGTCAKLVDIVSMASDACRGGKYY